MATQSTGRPLSGDITRNATLEAANCPHGDGCQSKSEDARPGCSLYCHINGACRLYEQHEALEIERDKRTWDKHGSSRFCVGAFLLAGSVRFPRF
ncbi:unnamed protein product [Eretmochelys imbricata]